MIRRIFFIVFGFFTLLNIPLLACDSCASSVSNMGMGLLTDYRSNFISLSYLESRFESSSEYDYSVSDRFSQMDLSLRFSLGKSKRLRLMARLPFGKNLRKSGNAELAIQGLSDINFRANYVLINSLVLGDKTALYLEAGSGIVLPTGKFDEQIHDKNLPENFNIGKGAFAYTFQLNTVFNRDKGGLVFNNVFQLNENTKSGYHFGNQLNSQLTLFRTFQKDDVKLIPNVGLTFEKTFSDVYANGNNVSQTGGKAMYFSTAFNFKIENWFAGVSYATPLSENFSDGAVNAKGKMAFQLSLIF